MNKSGPLKPYTVKPGERIKLKDISSEVGKNGHDKESGYERIAENAIVMADLAKKLYAENKRSILLVLQGMDTAGKDGTIRSVMRGMNPRSCQVVSFKKPNEEELDHDFLWRVHQKVPRRGNIGIFNRSHYEDVLVVRVHSLVPKSRWKERYEMINGFEKLLHETDTTVVKCFLHISKETQRERLQARLDDSSKHWKFNLADLEERKFWDDYQEAYEAVLEKCTTKNAPWHIIPSDQKWSRNLVVSELLRETMENLDPHFPEPEADYDGVVVE
jgi:PPK2 family polyphosphate:nucleotide phosphotransferase